MKLIDDWRRVLKRAWSIRVSIYIAALTGLAAVWSAFEGVVPLWLFVAVGVGGPVLTVVLRLIKQEPEE